MATPKFKKLLKKYKRYSPILVFLLLPFLVGVIGSFKVKEAVSVVNRKMRLANVPVTFVVESFLPMYLSTFYKISIKYLDKNDTAISVPVEVSVSNIPGLSYLTKGQMRFGFDTKIKRFDLHKDLRSVTYEAIVENTNVTGGIVLPAGFVLEGSFSSIKNSDRKFQAENITFDLNSYHGEWLSTLNGTNMKLKILDVDMTINDFKFTMNGDTKSQTNDYGFTIGFTAKVPTHSKTDLKFNSGGTIHNIPHDLDVIEREGMKAYSDSGSSFDVSASLSIGKPAFKSIAKGNAIKTGVEVEGIFDINIPEDYRQDKIIIPIVTYLNSNAEEFKKNYDVDLKLMKVNIPFNVKDRQFLLNGKRFYSCDPGIRGVTRNFKLEELKAIAIDTAKIEAIEDVLSEESPDRLAESYCRLHYAYEFSNKTDASLPALMNLLQVRASYNHKSSGDDSRHQVIALRKLKKDLMEDEEMIFIAQAYHCLINPSSKPCTDKVELIVHENNEHPFKKLVDLVINGTAEPMAIVAMTPKQGTKPYLIHAYELLQIKALNSYYLKAKMAKEVAENINKNSTKFTRHFMHYQIVDYSCNMAKEDDCLKSLERANPGFKAPRLTHMYIDLKVKILKDAMDKGTAPNCPGFVSQMAASIPLALENPRFQLLMKECPGGYIPTL